MSNKVELWERVTEAEAETVDEGRRLAEDLVPGDRLGISGPLGAGKTALVRGLCEGLGVDREHVSSPTFAIVNTYEGRAPVLHVDLYRVSDMDEVEATGLLDLADSSVMLIEWVDRVPELLSKGTLHVEIEDLGGDRRRLRLGRVR